MRLAFAAVVLGTGASLVGCHGGDKDRTPGQTTFVSAPMPRNGGGAAGGEDNGAGDAPGAQPPTANPGNGDTGRQVQETDLYRLEGNRLYYLNGYRGLMVFDVSDADHPKLMGRSPIFGSPVDMIVRNGVATVVVADWYGQLDDGEPFYGSIVRGLDATDPSNIKVLGEAKLGGWVRDDRVVGDVIYAVSENWGGGYGWSYGFGGGVDSGSTYSESVVVSSVSFANKTIAAVGEAQFPGYSGVFNVTADSIMLAHQPDDYTSDQTELVYLDISDPGGQIRQRGTVTVPGTVQGWGADNGRWNLDFADGVIAHVIGQHWDNYSGSGGYVVSTADFSNPDAPTVASTLEVAQPGWSATARFDGTRLYLSPSDGWWDGTDTTPFEVFDLSDPAAPHAAGTVTLTGEIWNILPAPDQRIFALGNDYNSSTDSVTLQYVDVTDPAAPHLIATSSFGDGWAWTPAAGTFKAFTMDAAKGLVVLPFAGWDYDDNTYNNGLQLIQFTPTSQTLGGAAHTRGWVERGIFVGNRLVSLSDLSLAVIDYSDPMAPSVINEVTLARNVITARPAGSTIAEVSSDWWDNDVSTSEVRVLPIGQAEEAADVGNVPTVTVDGVGARVFTNGDLLYVVTNVRAADGNRAEQVQVVDVSNQTAKLRGVVQLPSDPWSWWGVGWEGCFWWDWWDGGEVVQVGGDALAFRRWEPVVDGDGNWVDVNSKLYVVDVKDADHPAIASTTVQTDPTAWWGNMQVVGSELYTTHYEWAEQPADGQWWVKYYVDRIDLSDRAHPVVGGSFNVPGLLVGGDAGDPNVIYTVDYRWDGDTAKNDFDVLRLDDGAGTATLLSSVSVDGWVGNVFVSGHTAYMSAQLYDWDATSGDPQVKLHAVDVSDPDSAVDHVASGKDGWGWLLGVTGDRALVTSGWGYGAIDVYTLQEGQAPKYDQTVRTRGWWVNGVSRAGNNLYLSSGYWGVQKVDLQ